MGKLLGCDENTKGDDEGDLIWGNKLGLIVVRIVGVVGGWRGGNGETGEDETEGDGGGGGRGNSKMSTTFEYPLLFQPPPKNILF
jgi:hypothetical protein